MAIDYEKMEKEADAMLKAMGDGTFNQPAPTAAEPAAAEPAAAEPAAAEPAAEPAAPEPAAAEQAPAAEPTEPVNQLTGLTLENAENRIKNAQAAMHNAIKEKNDALKSNYGTSDEVQRLQELVNSQRDDIQKLLTSQQNQPAKVIPKEETVQSMLDSPELKEAMEEFPQVLTPVITAMAAQQKVIDSLKVNQETLTTDLSKTRQDSEKSQKQLAMEAHWNIINSVHADAEQTLGSPEFQAWFSKQPAIVRKIQKEGSAEDIVWLLNNYDKAIGKFKPTTTETVKDDVIPNPKNVSNSDTMGEDQPFSNWDQLNGLSVQELSELDDGGELDKLIKTM